MIDNTEAWIKRADAILANSQRSHAGLYEATSFATSMLTALYGPESAQLKAFLDGQARIGNSFMPLEGYVQGVIKNAKAKSYRAALS